MAVAIQKVANKRRIWENLLDKWGLNSVGSLVSGITAQTGVADGGADLTLTNSLKGQVIYDVDNDDYFLVTAAASATTNLN